MAGGVDYSDLYRLVLVSNPVMNNAGDHVLFIITRLNKKENREDTSIWMADETGFSPLTGGPKDVCPLWIMDDKLIAFIRKDRKEKIQHVMILDPRRGEPWSLLDYKLGIRLVEWSQEHQSIVAITQYYTGSGEWKKPYERDVLTAEGKLPIWSNGAGWTPDTTSRIALIGYPEGTLTYITPPDKKITAVGVHSASGKIAYAYPKNNIDPQKHVLVVRDSNGKEKILFEDKGLEIAEIAWSTEGDKLAIKARKWREKGIYGHYHVYVVDPDEEELHCISCSLDRNTMPLVNSDVRGPRCGSRKLSWGPDDLVYFTLGEAGIVRLYRGAPDTGVEQVIGAQGVIDEFSLAGTGPLRIAYTFMTSTTPPELYLYTGETGSERLTWFNDWLIERGLSKPHKYTIESTSGGQLDFWVLLPPGEEQGRQASLPWILYIHGGPKSCFGEGFMFEFHLLASKGFAIVYSNPHGSDCYTEDFADLSRGRLGNYDYNDLMLVADSAPTVEPSLDPEKAGVAGGSYGGWMTNYIVTRTKRFKAAVTQRSCSNWTSFWGASDIGWYFTPQLLSTGQPWSDPSHYLEYSPLFSADKIETPMLVIHSLEDYRCPLDQALQLYTALTVRGVPSRIALFPGEDHDLSRSGSPRRREARLREIVGWFERFLASKENNA